MKKRILITVDVDTHHAIRVVAAEHRTTVSSVYEEAARQLLDRPHAADHGSVGAGKAVPR